MTPREKRQLARAINSQFFGPVSVDWNVIEQAAEACKVENLDRLAGGAWPTIFSDIAEVDAEFRAEINPVRGAAVK